jgi:hypothetical protein
MLAAGSEIGQGKVLFLEPDLRTSQAAGARSPHCASTAGGGDCGGRVLVRARRRHARVSGRVSNWGECREQPAPEPPLRSAGDEGDCSDGAPV